MNPRLERLWDGERWTENTRERPTLPPPSAAGTSMIPGVPMIAGGDAVVHDARPKTNMVWAVIAVVLFCIPLGVVGIVYASKVNSLWDTGQHERARSSSKKALTWSLVGIGLGAVTYLVLLASVLAAGSISSITGKYSCNDLAVEAVRISEEQNSGTGIPMLLDVQSPRVVFDRQDTTTRPASGQVPILQCTGTGYFSNTESATVDLTLSLDPSGDLWVEYIVP